MVVDKDFFFLPSDFLYTWLLHIYLIVLIDNEFLDGKFVSVMGYKGNVMIDQ